MACHLYEPKWIQGFQDSRGQVKYPLDLVFHSHPRSLGPSDPPFFFCSFSLASWRSILLRIFPEGDLGNPWRNSTRVGTLYLARFFLQNSRISSSVADWPGLRTTKAFTVSPRYRSGKPTATASATWGCSVKIWSMSLG